MYYTTVIRKVIPGALGLLLCALAINDAAADMFCAELTRVLAKSGDFESLKGKPVEGDRFEAKTAMTGFRTCTVAPFEDSFSYTCETAPTVSQQHAENTWNTLSATLGPCLGGDWTKRSAGERNVFFTDQKNGEALSLSLREVAGFKRVGNQLRTFPTYYNRLSVFPRKGTKKTAK